jgi:hypothetical protein
MAVFDRINRLTDVTNMLQEELNLLSDAIAPVMAPELPIAGNINGGLIPSPPTGDSEVSFRLMATIEHIEHLTVKIKQLRQRVDLYSQAIPFPETPGQYPGTVTFRR